MAELDPNKPLRNRKHEKFAIELAKNPEAPQSEIYKEVYPECDTPSALANASRLLSNDTIRDRVLSLMSRYAKRDIVGKVSERLDQHIDSATESTSMDAIKTTLKLAGALTDEAKKEAVYNPVQIIIERCTINPKSSIDE